MRILVTGTAGFIGFHITNLLLKNGYEVTGIDSINAYYDADLKYDRLKETGIQRQDIQYSKAIISQTNTAYTFYQLRLEDKDLLKNIFEKTQPEIVVHLAAQAGVRYSLINPDVYISSNINGFVNVLECCRHYKTKHFIYASSSSVYGLNDEVPFSTSQNTDHPVSLYAATKKSNELMAHVYSHLFDLPATGLRFFTVYGPWGRPDMALFLFTKAILENKPIQLFNYGNMLRDFTYVGDIAQGVLHILQKPPVKNPQWKVSESDISASSAPHKIYNIGNNAPVKLIEFVQAIENELGIKAQKELLPLQPGDVPVTCADVSDLAEKINYKPSTTVQQGIKQFIQWYKQYYRVK